MDRISQNLIEISLRHRDHRFQKAVTSITWSQLQ